ncbi:MAG: M1 family metallopeptidase [Crocinitomicaceae bacterium]|nr:M1 family metallopeptidase [Crocinitomicaceae bacterium]
MKKIVFGWTILTLVSCGTTKTEITEIAVAEESGTEMHTEVEVMEKDYVIPTQRPVYRETETIITDLVHTKLEVNFDWSKSRMNGLATITAKPHFYDSDELVLDAKGMIINYVELNNKRMNFDYKEDVLTIFLDRKYSRRDEYTVIIDYIACPDEREIGGSAAITSDKGLYFINPKGEDKNKMPQIWTQGETEASSVWFPTIDSPNAKTTQEIFITVDNKYTTLSNGRFISSEEIEGGKRVDHWKQDLPHAPYLFMLGIGEFKIVQDSYTRPDGSIMEVNYYVEPEWEGSAKDIFGETPAMIDFFSEKLGVDYPWDKYHQIVVRDYVSGAMENTGAVIFGDYVYKNKRELLDGTDQSIIAHELFHHWFGDLVTCESWSNLTLNESFANYSQYLWDEHRYGIDEAAYNAEIEADGYYQSAEMQGYHELVWFDYDEKEQMFDGHSYNKGGRILHMLRNYIGDEAFFLAINQYLEEHKFKAAEFHQLRLVFEEVCGEDLNWFFNQWYLGAGHPTLVFKQSVDTTTNKLILSVEQTQDLSKFPIFKLPIQVAIFDNDGKHIHKVVIDEINETFEFDYNGELKGILYDDQNMLLAKIREDKTTDQYIYQYYHGENYAARKLGLMKGTKDKTAKGQQLILDGLNDPFWNIRVLAVGKAGKLRDGMKEKGIEMMTQMATNDPNSSVRVAALNAISKRLETDELGEIYEAIISSDSSYSVVSAALRNLGKADPHRAIQLAESLEQEKSSKMASGIAQLYAGYADENKFDFLHDALTGTTVQGFDKLGVLNSFTVFVTRQDDAILDKAHASYDDLSKNGGFYAQMFLPQNINYVVGHIDAKLEKLDAQLLVQEENDDAAYAAKTRKEIDSYKLLKAKYEVFAKSIEK